jgi:hypothetical protein
MGKYPEDHTRLAPQRFRRKEWRAGSLGCKIGPGGKSRERWSPPLQIALCGPFAPGRAVRSLPLIPVTCLPGGRPRKTERQCWGATTDPGGFIQYGRRAEARPHNAFQAGHLWDGVDKPRYDDGVMRTTRFVDLHGTQDAQSRGESVQGAAFPYRGGRKTAHLQFPGAGSAVCVPSTPGSRPRRSRPRAPGGSGRTSRTRRALSRHRTGFLSVSHCFFYQHPDHHLTQSGV